LPTPIKPNNLASKHRKNIAAVIHFAPVVPMLPPQHLSTGEAFAWNELIESIPAGILERSDALLIETTAKLIALSREAGISPALAAQIRGALASLGATPSDRVRLAGLATAQPEVDLLEQAIRG
jgi:hypothetical protein